MQCVTCQQADADPDARCAGQCRACHAALPLCWLCGKPGHAPIYCRDDAWLAATCQPGGKVFSTAPWVSQSSARDLTLDGNFSVRMLIGLLRHVLGTPTDGAHDNEDGTVTVSREAWDLMVLLRATED